MVLALGCGDPSDLRIWDINSESFSAFSQRASWPSNTEPKESPVISNPSSPGQSRLWAGWEWCKSHVPGPNEDSQACALPSGSLLVLGADLRGLPPWLLWAPHGELLGRDMKMGSEGQGSEGPGVWEWRCAALASQTDEEPGCRKQCSWMLKYSWPFCGGCSHVYTSTCSRWALDPCSTCPSGSCVSSPARCPSPRCCASGMPSSVRVSGGLGELAQFSEFAVLVAPTLSPFGALCVCGENTHLTDNPRVMNESHYFVTRTTVGG